MCGKYFKLMTAVIAAGILMTACAGSPEESETDMNDQNSPTDTILNSMTTEEKIGQMLIPALRVWTEADVTANVTELSETQKEIFRKHHFGGVILFGENISDEQQTRELISEIQKTNIEGGSKSGLFIGTDQEGGNVTRLTFGTQMPGNMALCAAGDPLLAEECAEVIGNELSSLGINLNFAPDLDVNINPSNPVIGVRSFSDDPYLTAEYGAEYIQGLHNAGVMTCIKHFPGHGDTFQDSHTGLPVIEKSMEELEACELIPFKETAEKTDMVMTAHIVFPQIESDTYISVKDGSEIILPATLSDDIIGGILRSQIGYEGVVITDSMLMDAVAVHFDPVDAAVLAVNAGADMILMPVNITSQESAAELDNYISSLTERVNNGEISIERLNESVRRILTLKQKYGLLDQTDAGSGQIDIEADRLVEWKAAQKAVTLIKNDNDLLPLSDDGRILITVPFDSQMNSVSYFLDIMKQNGIISSDADITVMKRSSDPSYASEAAQVYDKFICVSAMYSLSDINPLESENSAWIDALIGAAHENGKRITVISAQLPYDTARYTEADAVLACYNSRGLANIPEEGSIPDQYGANIPAALCTVLGGNSPSASLPLNIPYINDDYSYSSEILFGRGYGLTYK